MVNSSPKAAWSWVFVRRWRLIILVLFTVNLVFIAKAWKTIRTENKVARTSLEELRTENRLMQASLEALHARFTELTEIPLAYAETPNGLQLVPASHGASKGDIDFLTRFRGPIVDDKIQVSGIRSEELIATLKADIIKGFNEEKTNLLDGLTERQMLIAYTVLRTNGSMPTYEVRDAVPNDIVQLVVGTSGNCSDYTLRLMMILESIGVKASTISSVTKNLGGHVFVDAYDPQDDTAYLLDSSYNVMIINPHSNGKGFIETLLMMTEPERDQFSESVEITTFPVYFRFVDPGKTGVMRTPLTPDYINEQRADREPMWRRWLSQDTEQLVDWWRQTPNHAPRTLSEFSKFLSAIPREFNVSGDYASTLRKAAGLDNIKP